MTNNRRCICDTANFPVSRVSMLVFSVFLLFLLLRNADIAASFVRDSLSLCANKIIPSLFPSIVLAELIIASGIDGAATRLLERPMRTLFGFAGEAATALILGALCGFPVGARIAASLYDRGSIDRADFIRLLTFCNNTGMAFMIGTVGSALWSSRTIGLMLYVIQLLSAVLIGILGNICKKRKQESTPIMAVPPKSAPISFSRAIANSANSMMMICAYVVFFSSVIGTLGILLDRLSASPLLDAILFGCFELSSGMNAAASLADAHLGIFLSACFAGWSGIAVHFQIFALTEGRGISYRPYIAAKGLQCLLSGIFAAVWILFLPSSIFAPSTAIACVNDTFPPAYQHFVWIIFAGALAIWCFLGTQKMKNFKKIR
ncbi:MAG: hypothetical protein IJF49_03410 [Clostridia bacterium]|nr:hypothetical protein [Clostridia bacterium]